MKSIKMIAMCIFIVSFVFSNHAFAQKKWEAPAAEKAKVNPKAKDAKVTELGKTEWNNSCKSCHGKLGMDDGPKGKMTTEFAAKGHVKLAENIKKQTDGELFYKVKAGNGAGMPGYNKKIPDETIWGLVNYMRTLQK
jgi:mono/diheme cytochrome c family protein